MKQFKKILAYLENSNAETVSQVVDLAERHGAALTLCDVISPPPKASGAHSTMHRLNQLSWRAAFDNVRSLCTQHKSRANLNYTILAGEPFLAITEQVMLEGYDLVVHVSDTDSNDSGRGLNPTGMHLARKCPSEVWSLQSGSNRLPNNVVVAVDRDFSGSNRRTEALIAKLIDTATAVLQPGGILNLVHAWQPYGEALLDDAQVGMDSEEADAYVRTQEQEHQVWFNALVDDIDAQNLDLQLRPHLLRGPVTATINRLAEGIQADLIVLGTVGTSVVPGILIGMRAEALLSSSGIPVLAVKPADFVTPLQFSRSPGDAQAAAM